MSISCFGPMNLSDDSNFLFSRLDPFLILRRVNFFTHKAPSDGAEEIFGLTSCSAARGFRGIRILGSARDGGGRSNWMG